MKGKVSGIYCIENTINGKKYIGQSNNIYYRWRKHRSELNRNVHVNSHLQNSWNKYGQDNFKFYILEKCTLDELNKKEIYYIDYYNTINDKYGYNMKTGGQNCNVEYNDELKKKLSDSVRASYENSDLRQRRSEATKQYWSIPKNKERILGENNVMYGKKHSEESKRKMSEVKKSHHNESPRKNHTKVFCEELNKEYIDASTAGKELSLDSGGILKTCRGEHHTCGGYHWHFVY